MLDSSMPLVRQPIVQVYLVLGWGTLVCIEFLADSIHSTVQNVKGPVYDGDILTLLESGWDARRLK